MFTDRSLYRPQQKVLWKILAYEAEGEGRLPAVGVSLSVSLVDANGQKVASSTVGTSDDDTRTL